MEDISNRLDEEMNVENSISSTRVDVPCEGVNVPSVSTTVTSNDASSFSPECEPVCTNTLKQEFPECKDELSTILGEISHVMKAEGEEGTTKPGTSFLTEKLQPQKEFKGGNVVTNVRQKGQAGSSKGKRNYRLAPIAPKLHSRVLPNILKTDSSGKRNVRLVQIAAKPGSFSPDSSKVILDPLELTSVVPISQTQDAQQMIRVVPFQVLADPSSSVAGSNYSQVEKIATTSGVITSAAKVVSAHQVVVLGGTMITIGRNLSSHPPNPVFVQPSCSGQPSILADSVGLSDAQAAADPLQTENTEQAYNRGMPGALEPLIKSEVDDTSVQSCTVAPQLPRKLSTPSKALPVPRSKVVQARSLGQPPVLIIKVDSADIQSPEGMRRLQSEVEEMTKARGLPLPADFDPLKISKAEKASIEICGVATKPRALKVVSKSKRSKKAPLQSQVAEMTDACGLPMPADFDPLGTSKVKKTSASKVSKRKPKRPKKAPRKLTPEEKAKNLEERRKRESAVWFNPVKATNFSEYFSDSEESEKEENPKKASDNSDFEAPAELLDSSSESEPESLDEETGQEEQVSKPRPESKGPTSAFTLEIIADILETSVKELDANHWEEKIKNVFDYKIFKEVIRLSSSTRRYKCVKCMKQVKGTAEDVKKHMKDVHDSNLAFGCFFCPLARLTEKDLEAHERLHVHPNPKMTCTICDKLHFWKRDYPPKEVHNIDFREVHMQCHPPIDDIATYSPERQVKDLKKCVLCKDGNDLPRRATGARFLVHHILMHHVDIKDVCKFCGVEMNYWRLNHRHLPNCKKRILKDPEGPFSCEKCGWTVKSFKFFQSHNCSGKYNCKSCDAKFMFYSALKRHMRNVHTDLRIHVCHLCGKGFQGPLVLQDHINTHTGEKPCQCLVCGTRHTSKAGLAMHLRSRHNLTTREMKEKYKDCAVPDGGNDEVPETERNDKEKKEFVLNAYTGRKRGRPSLKKSSEVEDVKEDEGAVKRKPKTRKSVDSAPRKGKSTKSAAKQPRKSKRYTSGDSDENEKCEKESDQKAMRKRNTSSDSSDEEYVG